MENTAQIYHTVSIVAFSLAGVSFAFSIFCFLKFRIIKIINDLSGRTAKKSIAKLRNENKKANEKSFGNASDITRHNAKTDKMQVSQEPLNGSMQRNTNVSQVHLSNQTVPLVNTNQIADTDNSTTLLLNNPETDVLDEGTAVLSPNHSSVQAVISNKFEMVQNIILIHTNEII